MNKQDIKIKQSKVEIIWIILILLLIVSAFLLYLFMPNNIYVQFFVALVSFNKWNLLMGIVLLSGMYVIKGRILQNKINAANETKEREPDKVCEK